MHRLTEIHLKALLYGRAVELSPKFLIPSRSERRAKTLPEFLVSPYPLLDTEGARLRTASPGDGPPSRLGFTGRTSSPRIRFGPAHAIERRHKKKRAYSGICRDGFPGIVGGDGCWPEAPYEYRRHLLRICILIPLPPWNSKGTGGPCLRQGLEGGTDGTGSRGRGERVSSITAPTQRTPAIGEEP